MSFATKYRPSTLDEIVGNEETVSSLKNILERKREDIPHTFLFTGPAGCGKTTLARIVASALGCHDLDLHELNTANFRGIDTSRKIAEQMNFLPTSSSCRVWLLDECHQLTTDAQDALLKAIEEAPDHVYFIFGTTNPEKLKKTFLRRCMTFEVKALEDETVVGFLRKVATKNGKEVPKVIRQQIARDSFGSLGTALMILDKIIDLDPTEMAEAAKTFAETEVETIALCRALIRGERWQTVRDILSKLNAEPETVRRQVLGYCNAVLLGKSDQKTMLNAFQVMESFAKNFYDSGKAGLTMAAFEAVNSK